MKKVQDEVGQYVDFEELALNELSKKKLSEVELKELQLAMQSVNNAQMQIGGVEAYKTELIAKFSILVKELESTRSILSGKYGSVDIDMATGEVKEIKEDETNKKN